jgi:hypothetical protein
MQFPFRVQLARQVLELSVHIFLKQYPDKQFEFKVQYDPILKESFTSLHGRFE